MGPVTENATVAVPTSPAAAFLVRNRLVLLGVFLAMSIAAVAAFGFPERQYVWLWLVALAVLGLAFNPHRVARVAIDWLPVLIILGGYDFVRGFATDLVERVVIEPQLRFDEIVFGGTVPTVTLQRWLDAGNDPHPWDYGVFVFYLSHFVMSPVFALYLYLRDRPRFRRYAMVMLGVSLAGFTTYFIVPAAPPWFASRVHDLEHTVRIVYRVWLDLGATGAAKVFKGNPELANPVAALPSLHAAWPFMMLLFVWRRAPRGKYLALAYNGVMTFVLVYGSEHYVSDILLGWLYATVGFIVINKLIDRHDARQAARAAPT
jgi:hypothetical protein